MGHDISSFASACSRTNVRCRHEYRVSAQNTSSYEQQRRARYLWCSSAACASKQAFRQMTHSSCFPESFGTKAWPAGCFKEGEQNYGRSKFSG